jgi:hypothetical protein
MRLGLAGVLTWAVTAGGCVAAGVHPGQQPANGVEPGPAQNLGVVGDSIIPVNNPSPPGPRPVDTGKNSDITVVVPPGPAPKVQPVVELLPFQRMSAETKPLRAKSAARRYGNMSPGACAKELRTLNGMFKRVGAQKGVATPTRVIGPIEEIRFRVPGEKSKFGVLDCRLALTLVEFARFLKERGVTEVVVDNFYRVNARLPGKRTKRSQHAYGLAIDLRAFHLADGSRWDVEQDWGASTDTEPCGPLATLVSPTQHTAGLRNLVCELFEEQLFSHHLTPSHDAAHRNHLHLDIARDAKSVMIR